MKIKIILFTAFLYFSFADLIADLFNGKYYADPEVWVTDAYGSLAVTNTINVYLQDNGWNKGNQGAIAISDKYVYLVVMEKNLFQVYEFIPKAIVIDSCPKLKEAVDELKYKLNAYEHDAALRIHDANNPGFFWFDPPTFTLVEFDNKHVKKMELSEDELYDYGKTLYLARNVYYISFSCD
jgi:hypothetical protein